VSSCKAGISEIKKEPTWKDKWGVNGGRREKRARKQEVVGGTRREGIEVYGRGVRYKIGAKYLAEISGLEYFQHISVIFFGRSIHYYSPVYRKVTNKTSGGDASGGFVDYFSM
jgi:hypothetical protein